jgi:hypothetical protein
VNQRMKGRGSPLLEGISNALNVGVFGRHENNGIIFVFGIEIITVQSNTNLLFQNSKNNYYFTIPK